MTEQCLSAGSTLYESKRLSGLGRLTTGPVDVISGHYLSQFT